MNYILKGKKFSVKLMRDLNFMTARKIAELASKAESISIDLTRSKLVDSEALKLLYLMVKEGKKLILLNPPTVMFEAMKLIGLDYLIYEELIDVVNERNE